MKIEDRRRNDPTTVGDLFPGCVFVFNQDPQDEDCKDEYYIVTDAPRNRVDDVACIDIENGEINYFDRAHIVTLVDAKVVIS